MTEMTESLDIMHTPTDYQPWYVFEPYFLSFWDGICGGNLKIDKNKRSEK